ncbi:DUF4870 domain-containing protein [Sporosarcina sp. Te-1]|uniref:DUF4870 domain-containing protein n=1 Tax=Sporosarcina sp. Te-1 TaxID=2818390 RepID=UPI001A9F9447|nr:DUF4870 domain-containing protein [Sporosarcina sp. Te-1]QTD42909.1 DUF4870 domain-containing protein [Sporosarcina sp. Te-1]
MDNSKILSALCYFSIFFSPLLLPVIVYFVTNDHEVKTHAKRSLISHLAPVVVLIAGFFILSLSLVSFETRLAGLMTGQFNFWSLAPFLFMAVYGVLSLVIIVWNVYQGVKVLR